MLDILQDYNYDAAGCMEITVFTGCCQYPPDGDLVKLWHDHKPPLLQMLKAVSQKKYYLNIFYYMQRIIVSKV